MQAQYEDCWVPVGLEDQFEPLSSHPVIVNGYGLAVWRGKTGPIQVWEDRCPHRGMRLSFGFVREDRLTCLYHGWEYRQSGQCERIPAHPDLEPPKTICAKTFAARSRHGIVYTNLADTPQNSWPDTASRGWQAVRSIFSAVPEQRVRDYLGQATNAFGAAVVAGELDCLEMPWASGRIMFALQTVDAGKTGVHVTCRDCDLATRLELARKVARMRRELER